jgi:small-conductance mechanosensitive channel
MAQIELLQRIYFGNSLQSYLTSLLFFGGGVLALWMMGWVFLARLRRLAARTQSALDDFFVHALERSAVPAMFVGVFYFSMSRLAMSRGAHRALVAVTTVALTLLVIRFASNLIRVLLLGAWARRHPSQTGAQARIQGLLPITTIVVWTIGLLFLLDNLGFKVSAMVAGLGIGGVAVALAAQTVLGDLFAYFAILIDQPFVIGDFIQVGEFLGAVEQIGIKTTRLRGLGGDQVVFANKDLTDSRVRNYRLMEARRIQFTFGVSYATPQEKLKAIAPAVQAIVTALPNTRFDRAHFKEFASTQLTFEVVYIVLSPDYNVYMDLQQKINFAIRDFLEREGIEMPYGTTVTLRPPADAPFPASTASTKN